MSTSAPPKSPIENRWFFQKCNTACIWPAGYFMGFPTDFYTKFLGNCNRALFEPVFLIQRRFHSFCECNSCCCVPQTSNTAPSRYRRKVIISACVDAFHLIKVCGYLNNKLILHDWKKLAVASLLLYTSFTNSSDGTLSACT